VLDARQLLADLYAGRANLNALLANIEPTAAEAEELMNALRACEPPMPIPQDTVDG
jgi:ABC-type transporter Mla subunit MlaD